MIDYDEYEKAVLMTSDGDFACLVRHLYQEGKLDLVLSPSSNKCSVLLKRAARGRLRFMRDLRRKLEYTGEGKKNGSALLRTEPRAMTLPW